MPTHPLSPEVAPVPMSRHDHDKGPQRGGDRSEKLARALVEVRIHHPACVRSSPIEVVLAHLSKAQAMARSGEERPASKSKPYVVSMCRRMKVESAMISPPSLIKGSLPLGALPKPPVSVLNGRP